MSEIVLTPGQEHMLPRGRIAAELTIRSPGGSQMWLTPGCSIDRECRITCGVDGRLVVTNPWASEVREALQFAVEYFEALSPDERQERLEALQRLAAIEATIGSDGR